MVEKTAEKKDEETQQLVGLTNSDLESTLALLAADGTLPDVRNRNADRIRAHFAAQEVAMGLAIKTVEQAAKMKADGGPENIVSKPGANGYFEQVQNYETSVIPAFRLQVASLQKQLQVARVVLSQVKTTGEQKRKLAESMPDGHRFSTDSFAKTLPDFVTKPHLVESKHHWYTHPGKRARFDACWKGEIEGVLVNRALNAATGYPMDVIYQHRGTVEEAIETVTLYIAALENGNEDSTAETGKVGSATSIILTLGGKEREYPLNRRGVHMVGNGTLTTPQVTERLDRAGFRVGLKGNEDLSSEQCRDLILGEILPCRKAIKVAVLKRPDDMRPDDANRHFASLIATKSLALAKEAKERGLSGEELKFASILDVEHYAEIGEQLAAMRVKGESKLNQPEVPVIEVAAQPDGGEKRVKIDRVKTGKKPAPKVSSAKSAAKKSPTKPKASGSGKKSTATSTPGGG